MPNWHADRYSLRSSSCAERDARAPRSPLLAPQLLEPAAARAHERELGRDEEPVEQDQHEDGQQEQDAHPSGSVRSQASREPLLRGGSASLTDAGQSIAGSAPSGAGCAGADGACGTGAADAATVPPAGYALAHVLRRQAGLEPGPARGRLRGGTEPGRWRARAVLAADRAARQRRSQRSTAGDEGGPGGEPPQVGISALRWFTCPAHVGRRLACAAARPSSFVAGRSARNRAQPTARSAATTARANRAQPTAVARLIERILLIIHKDPERLAAVRHGGRALLVAAVAHALVAPAAAEATVSGQVPGEGCG